MVIAFGLAACGGGGGGSTSPKPAPTGNGLSKPAPPTSPTSDDWTTFAHDYQRTGYQAQTLTVTKANVGAMKLRWQHNVGRGVSASPIVAGGLLYIEDIGGTVTALDAAAGTVVWTQSLGGRDIAMTPTLVDGKLFVGTHSAMGDTFGALDAKTGAVLWSKPVSGTACVRGEPVVVNGLVIEGVSCGDPPDCNDGGVNAYDENTGAVVWSWKTTNVPKNGGGQWSPISYDGQRLYFGTGNVCNTKESTSDAVVSLSPSGAVNWSFQPVNPFTDDDFGGGVLINNGQAFVTGKDGYLFDLDATTGRQIWATQLTTADGYGPIGTPTTDGSILVISTGYKSDPTKFAIPGGGLAGVDPNGTIRWQVSTQNSVPGYAAIANSLAFVDLDSTINALDTQSGGKLWSYQAPANFYASPVIVPSGLYAVDFGGNVFAFTLPS